MAYLFEFFYKLNWIREAIRLPYKLNVYIYINYILKTRNKQLFTEEEKIINKLLINKI